MIRDIENLNCSDEFRAANFGVSSYQSSQNKSLPMFEITKNGFAFLVMGYAGEKAGQFKETFIAEFDKREAMLKSDDFIIHRALDILNIRTKQLESDLAMKDEVIKSQAPKVLFADSVSGADAHIQPTGLRMSSVSYRFYHRGTLAGEITVLPSAEFDR